MSVHAVIMCGGSGSRLWPASRPSQPKQFIALVGDRSSFQETVLRVRQVAGLASLTIVAGMGHEAMLRAQLAALGVEATLLLEPEPRDSAPAMAAAAAHIISLDPKGVAVILAADHHVPDAAAFAAACDRAALAAAEGAIVTLGVRPTAPSSAYGYIARGDPLETWPDMARVARFAEKPDTATAGRYIAEGYLWNSGNFVVSARTLLDELDRHAPGVTGPVVASLQRAQWSGSAARLSDAFREARKISIDYGVMEKTDRACVIPVDFEWSDLGAWDAVWAHAAKDADGNAVLGDPVLIDVKNTLVQDRGGQTTVAIGVENLAIITDADQVLVCRLDASQSVKTAFDRLKAEGRGAINPPVMNLRSELRSWLDLSALPLWASLGVDRERGGFHEELDDRGRATGAPRRMRVQARQAYVFARAGNRGWPGPAHLLADHGLACLNDHYRRPDGLFRTLVSATNTVFDDTPKLYDQAFALLAFAGAVDHKAAIQLLDIIEEKMSHAEGGYRENGPEPWLSNPHMHLLEAALAWKDSGGGERWSDLADRIANLALDHFIDPADGALREVFNGDWTPASDRIEPGHQFEWAWLLERWGAKRRDNGARAAARRLFQVGQRGIDPARGLAIDEMDSAFRPVRPTARLWPQTEWLKAALILGDDSSAGAAVKAVKSYLDAAKPGLWRDQNLPNGRFADGPSPASSLYHLAIAIEAFSPL